MTLRTSEHASIASPNIGAHAFQKQKGNRNPKVVTDVGGGERGVGVHVARLGRRSSAAEVGERLGSSRGEIEVEHVKGRREAL